MTSNNLVPVFAGKLQNKSIQLCNARDLHSFLECNRQFSDWIKGRITEYGFSAEHDFTVHKFVNGRATVIDYHLTLDMAKELGMIERTPKGREIRKYFIECERKQIIQHAPAKPLPRRAPKLLTGKTPLDFYFSALRMYAGQKDNRSARWIALSELVFFGLGIKTLDEITASNIKQAIAIIAADVKGDKDHIHLSLRYTL